MADDQVTDSTDQQVPDDAATAKPEIDWKAKSRDWEARAKANSKAAEELAALKQSQMTEQERLTAQLTEAHAAAETARTEALRLRVAVRHAISDEDAELFLTGTDEATLIRQAERLATREADRKKAGNHVAREGTTTNGADNDKRQFAQSLFGTD